MSKINWYREKVLAALKDAEGEVLATLAFRALEHAMTNVQANDQIDTGFMLNSGYAVSSKRDNYAEAMADAAARAPREAAPKVQPGQNESIAGFAAEYAVYQEMRQTFLFKGAEQAGDELGAIIRTVKL